MIAKKPEATRMRPVTDDDAQAVGQILALYVGDEPWRLDDLIPAGSTYHGVEIAIDGSSAIFEVFGADDWGLAGTPALGRVLIPPEAIWTMRRVTTNDDSLLATEILERYVGNELWKLDELIPGGLTFRSIKISTNGLAALFEVFAETDRAVNAPSLGHVLVTTRSPPLTEAVHERSFRIPRPASSTQHRILISSRHGNAGRHDG